MNAGAMLLLFDIEPAAVAEHDEWHSHEHMPERLAIPGFRRGSRWVRASGSPRYCVVYEVDGPEVLDSPAYRSRLNQPTPWTTAMMAHYRGMRRTLCTVSDGGGAGLGGACLLTTFEPDPACDLQEHRQRLAERCADLHLRRGVSGWRLMQRALAADMTREQAIRGRDSAVDSALWVTAYEPATLQALVADALSPQRLQECGARMIEQACFALAHVHSAS